MRPSVRAGMPQPAELRSPMLELKSPQLTSRETVVKREVDAYYISQITDSSVLLVEGDEFRVQHALDLPDTECEGLTFKLRVVEIEQGPCWLLARWKPDRYMRRSAGGISQKWFVEKELHPPNVSRFLQDCASKVAAKPEE